MNEHHLVIAEKPSVAMSIAKVLGAASRKDGYMEGGGYLVSWCVGHLVELAPADAYDPRYGKWVYGDLPIVPEHWQYIVPEDKNKQLSVLKSLMHRADVETVICATDAGREGQLIFQLVYNMCGCRKPVKRLWISSMEETAIRDGFSALRPGSEYDRLYQAALCRSQADWLVGINATRLFSVLYQRTLNVGRVQTPTLAMIVNRAASIERFRSEPFYSVVLDAGGFTAAGEKGGDRQTAETLCAACDGAAAAIEAVEQKERTEKAPALYDLTGLQRDANRLFGFTAQQTLDYTQSLYEKKLVTYPRTDSRFLTGDMAVGLPALVLAVAGAFSFAKGLPLPVNAGQVVNDAKVSDHHAIIPTATMPGADLSGLPAGERSVLSLIAARFLSAVGDAHRYLETAVTLTCGGHAFTAKGRRITAEGWKSVDAAFRATLKEKPATEQEKPTPLPELAEGQTVSVHASVKEGKTAPPKAYTEDTLLAAMECAGAEDMPEDAERKGLGTPATRAGIIEKLVRTEFVERKGKNLLPTQKGLNLIAVAPELIASPMLTAEWEEKLKQVEKGQLPAADFMDGITEFVSQLVKTYEVLKQDNGSPLFAPERESIGTCPRCGGPVVEIAKGFVCDNRACGFALWKENRFFAAKGKKLTKALAAQLLKDGRAALKGCHSEKTGKDYDAVAVLDDTGKYVNFKLEFSAEPKARKGGRKK
ncbi:MAG: DNA topoisomerase 3 [Oscillospiraceae bacterium]|nr:DNA topoisomerase 3 [Oscillospiraceae bacterium]